MSALSLRLTARTDLDDAEVGHLQRLVAQWQLLADLSFADLLLWVPLSVPGAAERIDQVGPHGQDAIRTEFRCVAQCRPTTGPTAHDEDLVGEIGRGAGASALRVALAERRIFRESDPEWRGDMPIRHEAIPVRYGDRIVAILGRDSNLRGVRSPSQLELSFMQTASDLTAMVADGTFPSETLPDSGQGPSIGDGMLRLDVDATIIYGSPNGMSALRRLGVVGEIVNERLSDLLRRVLPDPLEAADLIRTVRAAAGGTPTANTEVSNGQATVRFGLLPLVPNGKPLGALVVAQDVTELRRRDRQIISKDATIREIHHRVKNNLQTVAALLRLQARRVRAPEAREALSEAMRRVSAIALVHETLSVAGEDAVEFDEVVDRLLGVLSDVGGTGHRVKLSRSGSFGLLPASKATPLVLVLVEIVQNALEHGFGMHGAGEVEVAARRRGMSLTVAVRDDGVGLAADFDPATSDRLGLQIVQTLANAELGTTVIWRQRQDGTAGAEVAMTLNLAVGDEPAR
jgi:two-component system, sensor histidine kinase PdtaS